MPLKQGYVYLLASRPHGTLYTGVTSDLVRRVWQHRRHLMDGFTARYRVHRLVHIESFERITDALAREKQLKKWRRDWKVRLIEADNPVWADLAAEWFEAAEAPQRNGFPPARE